MATKGEMSESVLGSSDIIHDFSCTPCSEDGQNIEAVNFCENCKTYFCEPCVGLHSKLFKSHRLLDKADMKTGSDRKTGSMTTSMLLTEECDDHPGNVIQMYCGEHDIVCCTVCVAVDHRPCTGVEFIPKAAKTFLKEQDKNKTKISLEETCRDIEQLKSAKSTNILKLENAKKDILSEIQTIKDRIIAKVHELERNFIADVHAKVKETTDLLKDEISQLDKQLHESRHLLNSFQFQRDEEVQIFVKVKQGQNVISKMKALLSKFKPCPKEIYFVLDSDLKNPFGRIESFGSILVHGHQYTATMISEHDCKDETDAHECMSLGKMCVFDNGQYLLPDYNNNKLKRLNTNFAVRDRCAIDHPFSVCRTNSNEVAVSSLDEGKVNFVKIENDKMTRTRIIYVGNHCMGLFSSGQNLFVACGKYNTRTKNALNLYDINGSLLYSMTQTTYLANLSINSKGTKIYQTCKDDGLVILDTAGNNIPLPFDSRLSSVHGVCHDAYDNVFVCSEKGNYVIQLDENDSVISEILTHSDKISKPLSVTIIEEPLRMIVTSRSKALQVFKLT